MNVEKCGSFSKNPQSSLLRVKTEQVLSSLKTTIFCVEC
jgi:hypothetical protein